MLETAIEAAAEAGKLLKKNFGTVLDVNLATHHDVKLEMDERAQALITRVILADYPDHWILGEEAESDNQKGDVRWVIDPLDGTVNYFYGIPHYAVSIAAQQRIGENQWETVAGVVLDPERDELFTGAKGQVAALNGQPIHVSDRSKLEEAIVSVGFFKSVETINRSLQDFGDLLHRVRKMRLMGAAALDVVYVACGRYDAYVEYGVKIWDICAGQIILETAGGSVRTQPTGELHTLNTQMWNGKMPVFELTKSPPPP